MWPFRKKQPIGATTAFELAPIVASAIDAEIDSFGVEALSDISFALNPYQEFILVRGSLERPRSKGLIPDGTAVAALKDYPDLLSSVERAVSVKHFATHRELAVDFLALTIASVLIRE